MLKHPSLLRLLLSAGAAAQQTYRGRTALQFLMAPEGQLARALSHLCHLVESGGQAVRCLQLLGLPAD